MESQMSQPLPQGVGVAPQAGQSYQQAPQQYSQQAVPQYYPQANLYQAPMAQPAAPQPQAWQSQPSYPAVARLEALLSQPTPVAYSQTMPLASPYQGAAYPQPMLHQQHPGYLPSGLSPSQYPESRQTYSNTQAYSQGSTGISPADLSLASQIKEPAALASLAQIPSDQIDASKSALNAFAVELEERLIRQAEMIQQMAPLVKQAAQLKALFTPEGFTALSEVFLDQLRTIDGAYDHFLANGFSDLANAFAAPAREHLAQQQAQQQQQYQQSVPVQTTSVPQTYWGDGRAPLDGNDLRPQFPEIPNPAQTSGMPHIDLEQTPANMLWQQIDQISAAGGFRGTTFVTE